MDTLQERHVQFERLHNFRDFGGYPGYGGRPVRAGLLYRSDSLGKLTGADAERFAALGVRTVIDLRYSREVSAGGRVPDADGLAYYHCSIEHRPYDQAQLPSVTDPVRFLADRYAEVAADGVAEIGQVLQIIAASRAAPLVVHCALGKDRTGLIAAVVLTLLGVSEADVSADFALTELATARLRADWQAFHPDRELLWPFYGRAPHELMELVLAELAATYGSVREYVTGYLGQPPRLIEELRATYLAADPARI